MRRIFHIDLDAFFVSVERADNPSLEGKPVVVGAHKRGVVTCASYEARPYGLRAGMPIAQAQRLCPQAIYLSSNYERYTAVSAEFHRMLASYSPFVQPLSLDEAFVDMTGFESLYGTLNRAAKDMKGRIRSELKITASVGIASSKVAAKVASDLEKPDGLVEVPPGSDADFLSPMPVEDLPGVGAKTAKVLQEALGVKLVGQLAATPSTALRHVFGARGDLLRLWARGEDDAPVDGPEAPKSIGREVTFDEDSGDLSFLLPLLRQLTERVCADLRREAKKARRVSVRVRYHDFETVSHQTTLKQPISHDQGICDAGVAILMRTLKQRKAKVRLLGISVSDFVPEAGQIALFEHQDKKFADLSSVIDKVRGKYGFGSIQTGGAMRLGDRKPGDRRGWAWRESPPSPASADGGSNLPSSRGKGGDGRA